MKLLRRYKSKLYSSVKNVLLDTNKIPNIAKDKGVLFIHIPKAAGSTVSLGLYGIQIGHKKAKEYYWFDKKEYDAIKTFAFVRDPIDRFESSYYFIMSGGMTKGDMVNKDSYFSGFDDINDFVNSLTLEFIESGKIIHFLPQYEFIFNDGCCIVDKVFKLEEISDKDLLSEVGFSFPKKSRNRTDYSGERVALNESSIKRLKELYSRDYYLFGYGVK